MNTKLSIRLITLFVASTSIVGTAVSCSSGGTGGSGGAGTGGTMIVGGNTATTTTGAGGSAPTCTDVDAGNCYSCTPTTNNEFLNACNGLTCVPYDNSITNLPNLTADGGLPPITM
jgi:hypothetical protein